jgi:uncharacterized protein
MGRITSAGQGIRLVKKTGKRVKHIPMRTCVGCREVISKRTMTRIVRTPEGVQIDPTGKAAGRGAYLHNSRSCWQKALKGPLSRALKADLTEKDREELLSYMAGLPEHEALEESADETKAARAE